MRRWNLPQVNTKVMCAVLTAAMVMTGFTALRFLYWKSQTKYSHPVYIVSQSANTVTLLLREIEHLLVRSSISFL